MNLVLLITNLGLQLRALLWVLGFGFLVTLVLLYPIWFGLMWGGIDQAAPVVVSIFLVVSSFIYAVVVLVNRIRFRKFQFSLMQLFLAFLVSAIVLRLNFIPAPLPGGEYYGWPFVWYSPKAGFAGSIKAPNDLYSAVGNCFVFITTNILILTGFGLTLPAEKRG